MKIVIFSFLISIIIKSFSCAAEADLVENLFGGIYKGLMYSGYLNTLDKNKNLHYMFVESQSNPAEDPVVLWLNGGPGCSSLLGFIQEHGPVVIPDYTKELVLNKFAWNKNANIIYLESPAGVGYSYNDNGESDLKYDDDIVANDNRNALLDFFRKFPEFRLNDFYIAGESYAGVYVPKLAENVLQNSPEIMIKGILVGNGLTDLEVDIEGALIDLAYGHGLYSMETHLDYKANCTSTDFSDSCIAARKEIRSALQGLNIYDIYRTCPKPKTKIMSNFFDKNYNKKNMEVVSQQQAMIATLRKINKQQRKMKMLKNFEIFSEIPEKEQGLFEEINNLKDEDEGVWPDGCADDPYPTEFFNSEATKEKMHVRKDITYVQCNNYINSHYKFSDSLGIYHNTLIHSGLRLWFFSGDTDGAVPFTGTQKWLPKLNMAITEPYRKWVVNEQTAGYVQSYESMVFATVMGAGHMAPQWKREQSFILFNAFLGGERLPEK